MNWTALLKSEMEETYRATEGLMDLVDEDKLDWVPETGENSRASLRASRWLTAPTAWKRWSFSRRPERAVPGGTFKSAAPAA